MAVVIDADRIARFTGPYNLPGGMVPVVDGVPRWPWDEVVARRRLGHVAKLAGLLTNNLGMSLVVREG